MAVKRFTPSTCGDMLEVPDGEWVPFDGAIDPTIIKIATEAGEFVPGDDGFVVWFPRPNQGAYTAGNLKALAMELDRHNAGWSEHLDQASQLLKCPECGADRTKEPCGRAFMPGKCPMSGYALTAYTEQKP
jgi:hypothetical protein